ncbi:hypothetical protein A2U01_0007327 [Trifolium medium]|uniref:Transmembrane protein n=1 Tax=Trifolium medium TaxID=97028 RepID=A0A392MG48_9FABA|nr:hypothetical protein [Trifolium medium]
MGSVFGSVGCAANGSVLAGFMGIGVVVTLFVLGFDGGVPPMGCWFCLVLVAGTLGVVVWILGVGRVGCSDGGLCFFQRCLGVMFAMVAVGVFYSGMALMGDFLLIPEASGGLHRARCVGGLQFAQICVECV